MKIAILGYGIVGSGVFDAININREIISKNAGEDIFVKYILARKSYVGTPIEKYIVNDFNIILEDKEVKIIVEAIGGINPALGFARKTLENGKVYITSNKELIAKHGDELFKIASLKNTNLFFEGSVAGGVPIVRSIINSITADKIETISGILNGTTNYILSKMLTEDGDYFEVLKEAQNKGYAEKDPKDDVEGYDTCRKIAILASIITGKKVNFESIFVEGITNISSTDIKYVNKMQKTIKLLAVAKNNQDGSICIRVAPCIIGLQNPLAYVNDAFNAVLVKGNLLENLMFYGLGAGKEATASAVITDIIEATKTFGKNIYKGFSSEEVIISNIKNMMVTKFIRVSYNNKEVARSEIINLFGDVLFIDIKEIREFAFITNPLTGNDLDNKLKNLTNEVNVINTIFYEG